MSKKIVVILIMILFSSVAFSQTPTEEELVNLHDASTANINAIVNPYVGSLVYDSDTNAVYVYDGSIWRSLKSDGSETVINGGDNITVTGNGTSATNYIINANKPTLVDNGDNTYTFSNGIDTDITFNTMAAPVVAITGTSSQIGCDAADLNATIDVTFTGENFTNSSTISIPGQTVNSVTFVSSGQITANITASSTGGNYDVTITNEYGTDTLVDGFYVKNMVIHSISVAEMILSPQVSYDGTVMIKTGGATIFEDHQGYTTTYAIPADQEGYIEFTPTGSVNTNRFMVGLDPDPAVDADWQSMDYVIYIQDPGNLRVYEDDNTNSSTPVGSFGSQTVGDVFRINVDCNGEVTYLKNGTVFYTSLQSASGKTLYFDSSFKNTNSEISNIKIAY